MKLKHILSALLTSLALLTVSSSQAAAYMKLGDIKGDATDTAHKEWIIIQSFSLGFDTSIDAATGQRLVAVKEIQVAKSIDKSSPLIMQNVLTGETTSEVIIEFTKETPAGPRTYLRYKLTDVLVSSYSTIGTESPTAASGETASRPVPVDSFSLNYESITFEYNELSESGEIIETTAYTWRSAPSSN